MRKTFEAARQLAEARIRELERQRDAASSMRQILTMLNAHRPEKDILDFISRQAFRLTDATATGIYRFDDETRFFVLVTGVNLPAELANMEPAELAGPELSNASSLQPILCPIISTSLSTGLPTFDQNPVWIEAVQRFFSGFIAVPLAVQGEAYGWLILFYAEARAAFASVEIDLALALGDQIALGIENLHLRIHTEQTAISTERARLARDLHDSVTQTLFSASLIADILPRLWEKEQDEGRRQLAELRALTKGALAEMRTLLLELRPAALIRAPLPDTLRHLVDGAAGHASIPIKMTAIGITPLPPEVKVAFYRIAQEALNNLVKHAEASSATVVLDRHADIVELRITDDGRGFNVDGVGHGRLGLSIMRERAHSIGATLTIESQPGHGARISVTWHRPQTER